MSIEKSNIKHKLNQGRIQYKQSKTLPQRLNKGSIKQPTSKAKLCTGIEQMKHYAKYKQSIDQNIKMKPKLTCIGLWYMGNECGKYMNHIVAVSNPFCTDIFHVQINMFKPNQKQISKLKRTNIVIKLLNIDLKSFSKN